ncbi:MAG: FtsH protease activity modulator HflK [Nitrospirota bacterium]
MDNEDVIDIKDLQIKAQNFFKNLQKGGGAVAGIIIMIWLATGIYLVGPDEIGIVKRFGAFVRTTPPGPHYHFPFPVETVLRPKVTKIHRVEVGFRTVSQGPPLRFQEVPKEALMLTGDENIVAVEFIVQYKISDPINYLFNVRYPKDTIKAAAEASIRDVIGKNLIDEVLTVGKAKMQEDTMILLQSILDGYKTGIQVVAVQLQDVSPPKPVIAAFKDVASAREDKEKLINQAQGYRNDILPKAKGEAAVMINKAKGYTETRIKRAEGEANRFLRTLEEYSKTPDIIRKRIYIETMEEILPKTDLIIMEGKSSQNILPYLPLKRGRE